MLRPSVFLASLVLTTSLAHASAGAGPDQFICGTATVLDANAPGAGESGFWSVVVGTGNFDDSNSPGALVSGLSFGENILRWTLITSEGPSSDLCSVWCYDVAMPHANAGADQSVGTWPGTAQLSASVPVFPGACYWVVVSGIAVISDPNNPSATASALGAGTNVLQWNCDNGPCGASQDEMIIDGVVGIEEISGWIDLRYDAQAHRLVFGAGGSALSVTLFDAQGRAVEAISTPPGAGAWDLGPLPAGIYVVQATGDALTTVQRFAIP